MSLMSSFGRAEGVGLREVAEHEADDEGHRREQPADRGGAERHPPSVSDARAAHHVRLDAVPLERLDRRGNGRV